MGTRLKTTDNSCFRVASTQPWAKWWLNRASTRASNAWPFREWPVRARPPSSWPMPKSTLLPLSPPSSPCRLHGIVGYMRQLCFKPLQNCAIEKLFAHISCFFVVCWSIRDFCPWDTSLGFIYENIFHDNRRYEIALVKFTATRVQWFCSPLPYEIKTDRAKNVIYCSAYCI